VPQRASGAPTADYELNINVALNLAEP